MKMNHLAAVGTIAIVGVAATATSADTITVVPSSAPNQFGSPSYAKYFQNALAALEAGSPTFGGSRTTDPTAYEAAPAVIGAGDNIATTLPPASSVTGARPIRQPRSTKNAAIASNLV